MLFTPNKLHSSPTFLPKKSSAWNWWPFCNTRQHSNEESNRKIQKLVEHAQTFATHCTMQFLCKCVFFKHIIGVYWKLDSLEIRPEDSHNTNQKSVWGISDFHNLSITVASDVTHNRKTLMSKLDRKHDSKLQ